MAANDPLAGMLEIIKRNEAVAAERRKKSNDVANRRAREQELERRIAAARSA
jgi:hypothetical protein